MIRRGTLHNRRSESNNRYHLGRTRTLHNSWETQKIQQMTINSGKTSIVNCPTRKNGHSMDIECLLWSVPPLIMKFHEFVRIVKCPTWNDGSLMDFYVFLAYCVVSYLKWWLFSDSERLLWSVLPEMIVLWWIFVTFLPIVKCPTSIDGHLLDFISFWAIVKCPT